MNDEFPQKYDGFEITFLEYFSVYLDEDGKANMCINLHSSRATTIR
jgi:hypothetical protein